MGVILDILKEVPLAAVYKERLSEKEAEMETLKSENKILKAKNAKLHTKLQKIEHNKTIPGDTCPYCQTPNGKLLDIQPHKIFGAVGVKVLYYQCENCDKKYDKEKRP